MSLMHVNLSVVAYISNSITKEAEKCCKLQANLGYKVRPSQNSNSRDLGSRAGEVSRWLRLHAALECISS